MKKVLLVLTASGTPDKAIEYAVERAVKERAGVVALYILETGLAGEVFDKFTDMGFIGDKPSSELTEALMRDYRQRGYEELGRVQIKAMEAGVDYEPIMEEGDFVSRTIDAADKAGAGVIVLAKRKERHFFKYFSRSLADEVKKRAGREVVVFDE